MIQDIQDFNYKLYYPIPGEGDYITVKAVFMKGDVQHVSQFAVTPELLEGVDDLDTFVKETVLDRHAIFEEG